MYANFIQLMKDMIVSPSCALLQYYSRLVISNTFIADEHTAWGAFQFVIAMHVKQMYTNSSDGLLIISFIFGISVWTNLHLVGVCKFVCFFFYNYKNAEFYSSNLMLIIIIKISFSK